MITFRVPGIPVAKGRVRVTKSGHAFTPGKTVSFEGRVAYAAAEARSGDLLEGPLYLSVIAVWPYRKSDPKRIRESGLYYPKDTKPDKDNVEKAIADGCEGVLYANDSQIADGRCRKFWGPLGFTQVKIYRIVPFGISSDRLHL